jgi:Arc/MetJ-type ribon-helix-helix transcriptional regulator
MESNLKYYKGMKTNTKSSITLPPHELKLVENLKKKLKAKSNVEVIRKGLYLLKEKLDRQTLQELYSEASSAVRVSVLHELDELDSLSGEGID